MWTELKQHSSPILGPPRLSPIKKTISWEKHDSTPNISKNVLRACSDVTFWVFVQSPTHNTSARRMKNLSLKETSCLIQTLGIVTDQALKFQYKAPQFSP